MQLDPTRSHLSWFGRRCERVELEGVVVFLGAHEATIAFPLPGADVDGAVRLALDAGAREVGCWSLAPDEALGARLHGLGFQDGWAPHWMGIDLDARDARPEPLVTVEETTDCDPGLPYSSTEHVRALGGDVHHFVVREEGQIVGHAVLDVAGEVGGVYDMGVVPAARRRGHARALTEAALARAREVGCSSVTLNATGEGEPVYRSAGFESLGWGMTWWLFPRS